MKGERVTLSRLKNNKEEGATGEHRRVETDVDNLPAHEPADPRPLPVTHNRHLDVDGVLARSIPGLSRRI